MALWIAGFLLLAASGCIGEQVYDEKSAVHFMETLNQDMAKRYTKLSIARWAFDTNITKETEAAVEKLDKENAKIAKTEWQEIVKYPWKTFKNETLKRLFSFASLIGSTALPDDDFAKLLKLDNSMVTTYAKAKLCDFKNRTVCNKSLDPELSETLKSSRDPEELKYVWVEWRNATGKKMKQSYVEHLKLSNKAAILNDMKDTAEYWLFEFQDPNFEKVLDKLWLQLKPLYDQLHAYVRMKLRQKYGEEVVSKRGPIPAHLLGNMWAQTWSNIFDLLVPFPNKSSVDVTQEMVKQNYTPLKMFKMAEEFFVSLGLHPMPESFWNHSVIEKPPGRELNCHASAWDFSDNKDFRIKQCTVVTQGDFTTVHHEMGHIQYSLCYRQQHFLFKTSANSGFHEAIGDVMSLSVSTRTHLKKIGLLKDEEVDHEALINHLLFMSLSKVSFLPFGYILDLWRWKIFRGEITEENYNCEWWKLRGAYQGVEPPVDRTEQDFDPGAKYHVAASVPYVRYFISHILEFQFHEALCIEAGQFNPKDSNSKLLSECDIYQSKKAGDKLRRLMELGASKPWPEALEVIVGKREMDASSILNYFKPLLEFLKKENEKNGEYVGWEETKRKCTKS